MDATKMPIIGTVTTKAITWSVTTGDKTEPYEMPSATYSVVAIDEINGQKTYITNIWHKEHKRVPLVIVEEIVEKYEPVIRAEDGTEIILSGSTDIEVIKEAEEMERKINGKPKLEPFSIFYQKWLDGILPISEAVKYAKPNPEEVRYFLITLRERQPDPQLTMLSFGGGQDSFAILYSLIYNKGFRKKYAPNDFFVAMSDTGNEHPHTYQAVKEAEAICKKHNIHFILLTPDMGYHTNRWKDLKSALKQNSAILSASMMSKPCTGNLKINVVDKYMYHYMCELYGFDELDKKKSWPLYVDKFKTRARVLIGFAKDEEMRGWNSVRNHQFLPAWKTKTMQYVYPLIESGIDRETAQGIIAEYHEYNTYGGRQKNVMPPSNCMLCFYQSEQELLWLEHHYPEELNEWIEMEKAKYKKSTDDMPMVRGMMEAETDPVLKAKLVKRLKGMEINYGVYGNMSLPEKLEKARRLYGPNGKSPMTIEQLNEYKMSHGHCIKSSF